MGVAVKVTLDPAVVLWLPAVIAIDTEGVNVTVIVITALVAVVGVAQVALLVKTQRIKSLLASVVAV